MVAALLALACFAQFIPTVHAQGYFGYNRYYANPYYYNSYYSPGVFTTHPILSSTLAGTAIGALGGVAVGALQQADSHNDSALGIGAAVGAGTGAALGAGFGLIRNRNLYGSWF